MKAMETWGKEPEMDLEHDLGVLGKEKRNKTVEAGERGWWKNTVIPGGTRDVPRAWEPCARANRHWLGGPC